MATTILATDWNPLQTTIKSVIGTPSATTTDLGYNTSVASSQVSTGTVITGAEWNTLRTDIDVAYTLQTGSASGLTTRTTTDIITQADFTAISGKVDTALTNKGTASLGQLTYTAYSPLNSTAAWTADSHADVTFTWSDNNKFRGFWNAGGRIVFTASRSGGSANSQNQGWTNVLTNMGTITLTRTSFGQSGQTWNGTVTTNYGTGMYGGGITTALTGAFIIYDTDTNYTSNYYRISLSVNNADLQVATSLRAYIECIDAHTPLGAGPDTMDGTLVLSASYYSPFSNAPTVSATTAQS